MEQFRHVPTDKDLETIVNGVLETKRKKSNFNYKPIFITTSLIIAGIVIYQMIKPKPKIRNDE
jgi:hypothetical protein